MGESLILNLDESVRFFVAGLARLDFDHFACIAAFVFYT